MRKQGGGNPGSSSVRNNSVAKAMEAATAARNARNMNM